MKDESECRNSAIRKPATPVTYSMCSTGDMGLSFAARKGLEELNRVIGRAAGNGLTR